MATTTGDTDLPGPYPVPGTSGAVPHGRLPGGYRLHVPATPRLVRCQPGFVLVVGLLAVCGWQLHQFHAAHAASPQPQWLFAVVFTGALLVLVGLHECGHVLAARLHGHRVTSVRIGSRFGVTTVGEHTDRSVRLTALAGPVLGTLTAGAVLLLAPPLSALWAAALVALVENLANVGLFFVPGTDGAKIVAGRRCLPAPALPAPPTRG